MGPISWPLQGCSSTSWPPGDKNKHSKNLTFWTPQCHSLYLSWMRQSLSFVSCPETLPPPASASGGVHHHCSRAALKRLFDRPGFSDLILQFSCRSLEPGRYLPYSGTLACFLYKLTGTLARVRASQICHCRTQKQDLQLSEPLGLALWEIRMHQ